MVKSTLTCVITLSVVMIHFTTRYRPLLIMRFHLYSCTCYTTLFFVLYMPVLVSILVEYYLKKKRYSCLTKTYRLGFVIFFVASTINVVHEM